jgi:hypothetical protein
VWDRVTGQIVLFALTVLVIPALPQPLRTWMLWALAATIVVVLVARASGSTVTTVVWEEAREVAGAPGVWSRVFVLSTLAAAGHVAVFIIAARSVGVTTPTFEPAERCGMGAP